MSEEIFWMVYVEGGRGPTFQHKGKNEAVLEAERLAKETGKKAWLLQAVSSYEYRPVIWTHVDDADEQLPF